MEKHSSLNNSFPTIFNLSNYTAPVVSEEPSLRWIKYGENNLHFDYLLDRYKGSTTNHALINGIYQMIVGDGLDSPEKETKPEEWKEVQRLFTYDDVTKYAFDLKWGGFYMQQIILNKELTKIASIKHTPVEKWRSGKANSKGKVESYWYSDNWEKYTSPKYRPVEYPAYDIACKEPIQILAVKPYRAGSFYYPSVDYQGGLQYAHIEEEISNFHINNLLNGMFPGLLINFNNGDPGPEERQKMEEAIKRKWGKTSNSGRMIVAWNDDKERSATVDPVTQPDLDKMFDLLSKESSNKLMIAHRVTSPRLFGVNADGGGLGNNADELRVSSMLFENTVMRPYRHLMIQNIESLLIRNGIHIKVEFKSLNPFPSFPEVGEETPNKMDITDNATEPNPQTLSVHSHSHIPNMDNEQEKALLNAITPFGEIVDKEEWFEVDASPVKNELEEDKIFSDNGADR